MDDDPERAARAGRARGRDPRARARAGATASASAAPRSRARYDVPRNVLDRLAELGVLTPDRARLRRRRRARSSRRSRASARAATTRRSASPSSTRCATARRSTPLVEEEVRTLLDRLAGEVERRRAPPRSSPPGAEPLRELIGAMHSKLLLAELERQRGGEAVGETPPAKTPGRGMVTRRRGPSTSHSWKRRPHSSRSRSPSAVDDDAPTVRMKHREARARRGLIAALALDSLYLLLGLPMGIVFFTLVVAGWSTAIGSFITFIGIPVALLTDRRHARPRERRAKARASSCWASRCPRCTRRALPLRRDDWRELRPMLGARQADHARPPDVEGPRLRPAQPADGRRSASRSSSPDGARCSR